MFYWTQSIFNMLSIPFILLHNDIIYIFSFKLNLKYGVSLILSWISICISHILSTHLLHVVKVAITYDHVDLDREEWVDSIKTGGRVVNFILKEVCYFWWYFNELIWGFMFPKSLRRLEKKRDRIYRKSQYWNKNDEKNVNERVQNKNLFLSNIKIIIFGKHRSIPIF